MAEERSKKLYGKSPKIVPADGPAGEEREAVSKIRETAGEPNKEQPAAERKDVDATQAGAGTISMEDLHSRELKKMHTAHERERRDMHTRHEADFKRLQREHGKDADRGEDKKGPQEAEATAGDGTEPGGKK